MAVRLSGSISRKIPIKGVEFSSQSFGASLEIEINSADAGEVQSQLARLYSSLNQGIDAQIAAASAPVAVQTQPTPTPSPAQPRNGAATTNRIAAVTNGNGAGKRVTATEAQQRAIFAICKSQNLDVAAILADFNVVDSRDLHVKDASKLIDQLKARHIKRRPSAFNCQNPRRFGHECRIAFF